ncbi:MAG: hypothetical protein K6G27_15320 [Lachnospiraceae bacterium]|nr:hypothetical protein [Lachnospiraceae bacterium]
MDIKELRAITSLSPEEFADRYGIPIHTLHKWELPEDNSNFRSCRPYILSLLERAVKEDFPKGGEKSIISLEKENRDLWDFLESKGLSREAFLYLKNK